MGSIERKIMSRSYISLFYHFTWSTKGRKPYFSFLGRKRLYRYIGKIVTDERVELLAIGGVHDHVHILVKMNSVDSIAKFMRKVKSTSSAFVKRTGKNCNDFVWQSGYAVFSVNNSNVDKIRHYIKNQEEHHKTRTFEDELTFFTQF